MERINWHRLFGLLLTDYFTGSPFVVELEKDLSMKKQLLDVIVLRKGDGNFAEHLPDGFDNLTTHNLITFKSHHEALDDWALKELTGHYVNYRKQIGETTDNLLPEEEFRLYAVSSRYPDNLARASVLTRISDGVYECHRGTDVIRVIVLRKLPTERRNALWHAISGKRDRMEFGATHYQFRSPDSSTLLDQIFEEFAKEGMNMPYTMEDFRRDFVKERGPDIVKQMSTEQLLKSLTPQQIEEIASRRDNERASRKRKKKK